MIQQLHPTGRKGTLFLALAALWLLPAGALGESIVITNATPIPLVVQMASVINGTVRRDRPYPVYPGRKVKIVLPGNKVVHIYDGRIPNRILFQGRITPSTDDQFFAIQPDPRNPPRMDLHIVKPPPLTTSKPR